MLNILSYVGMSMQSEVCMWTLLGLLRTIFDATLFKVNANLKQVWQMSMPEELSMPVQRLLRTMISGVMLVQCFTVYVYLASYIVLLYPVFLEERPTLVLPWLLLAAIRKLLCELTCLALGLGTCVLLGPARPSCIKFVVVKIASIMPSFYMWMLVLSYYHALKVTSTFKSFTTGLPSNDHDYGLELAVRRRCTKSLLDKDQLRKKLVESFYSDRSCDAGKTNNIRPTTEISSKMVHSTNTSVEESGAEVDIVNILQTLSVTSNKYTYLAQSYEDWSGSEIVIPRDTDRILEQFVLMLLRIGAYLKKEGTELIDSKMLNSPSATNWGSGTNINLQSPVLPEITDTPPQVGSQGNTAWYLHEYPQIFMKKQSSDMPESKVCSTNHTHRGSIPLADEDVSVDEKSPVNGHKISPPQQSRIQKYDRPTSSKAVKLKQVRDTKLSSDRKHITRLSHEDKNIVRQDSAEEKCLSQGNSKISTDGESESSFQETSLSRKKAVNKTKNDLAPSTSTKNKETTLVNESSRSSSETEDHNKLKSSNQGKNN